MGRSRGTCALVVPLVLATALAAPRSAAAAGPSWCDDSHVLLVDRLPAEMPFSQCALTGRVIARRFGGIGVGVPPPGRGVAASAGDETVEVWTDEYAVHVREDVGTAMLRYADRLTGAAPGEDRGRLARSLARYVSGSVGIVASEVEGTGATLDHADEVERWGSSEEAPSAAMREMIAHLRGQVEAISRNGRDERPDVRALRDEVQRALARAQRDVATVQANRDLATFVVLRGYGAGLDRHGPNADIFWVDVAIGAYRDALVARAPVTRLPPLPDDARRAVGRVAESVAGDTAGSTSEDYLPDATSPPPCNDTARAYYFTGSPPTHWATGRTIRWHYNYTNQFPRYSATGYSQALARAFNGMTGLSDDCGFTWHPDIYNAFAGFTTTVTPNASLATCNDEDDTDITNVIGWSPSMPTPAAGASATYAYTCVFRDINRTLIDETDVVMSTRISWDIPELDGSIGYTCTRARGDLDVQGAMTHEFGHSVGLGHVDEATHGRLTMSPVNDGPCQRQERTLGRGDSIGLSSMYGQV